MEVEVLSSEYIKPSSPTPQHLRTYKVSLLDQLVPSAHIPIILFYERPTACTTEQALQRMKQAASEALPRFYPFAGRIKDDLYIDCNDDGCYYAEARVNCSLSDFLTKPNGQMIRKLLPNDPRLLELSSDEGIPILMGQVNVFTCGGIALGTHMSHKIIDGPTSITVLKAWSATARGCPEEVSPSFIAPSLFPQSDSLPDEITLGLWPALLKQGKCATRRFVFDAAAVATIKAKAASQYHVQHPTRIEAMSAFIWKCCMEIFRTRNTSKRPSVLFHMINLRGKNATPLPEHTIGNLLWLASSRCDAEADRELQPLVGLLRESFLKLNVEFFQQFVGEEGTPRICEALKEMGKAFEDENVDYLGFASLFKLGVYEADFGWGKPLWMTPGGFEGPFFQNLIFLNETRSGDGMEAWISLSEEDMGLLVCNEELLSFASLDPSPLELCK